MRLVRTVVSGLVALVALMMLMSWSALGQAVIGNGAVNVANLLGCSTANSLLQGGATPACTTSPGLAGLLTKYNGIATVSEGIPYQVATVDLTAQGANIGSTTLYTVGAANGYYRVACYTVLTRSATTSSTLPACNIGWTDADTGGGPSGNLTGTNAGNTVGNLGANPTTPNTFVLYAQASTTITYSTNSYASVGATSMQYAIHIRLERLG